MSQRPTAGQVPEAAPAIPPAAEQVPKGVRDLIAAKRGRFEYTDFVKRALAVRIVPELAAARGHLAAVRAPEVMNARADQVESAIISFARILSGATPPPRLDERIRNQNRKADDLIRSVVPQVGSSPPVVNSVTGEVLDAGLRRFDWRDRGWVVRDSGIISRAEDQTLPGQPTCGCCWAFATIGTFGGAYALVNLRLVAGSEQELLDCVGPSGGVANSCAGGWWAFDYLIDHGVASRANDPYVSRQQPCRAPASSPLRAVSWRYVLNQDVVPMTDAQRLQIKAAMTQHGPIAATMYAETTEFAGYGAASPPIKSFASGNKVLGDGGIAQIVDHAIVLVGWDDGKNAWAIKNSWGEGWGQQGFGYVDYSSNNIGYGAAYVIPARIDLGAEAAASPPPPALRTITIPRVFPGPPPAVESSPR
jgi:hypothetical protein